MTTVGENAGTGKEKRCRREHEQRSHLFQTMAMKSRSIQDLNSKSDEVTDEIASGLSVTGLHIYIEGIIDVRFSFHVRRVMNGDVFQTLQWLGSLRRGCMPGGGGRGDLPHAKALYRSGLSRSTAWNVSNNAPLTKFHGTSYQLIIDGLRSQINNETSLLILCENRNRVAMMNQPIDRLMTVQWLQLVKQAT